MTMEDNHPLAKGVLEVGHLVRELTAALDPRDYDVWFILLRGDLGDVQAFYETQSAEEIPAA